ncbi:MAG: hypothetical protein RLZZ303_1981 [Candidatus Hydrogenedentota bacterium]|jgi:translation initiation factor IF-2
MQTIASLADRLDMTPQEAVETLRKLNYDIEGVETEISDDQCDILMDVDEDPAVLTRLLAEQKKKEEQDRKRVERLQKANAAKKAAAAKKPAKKSTETEAKAEVIDETPIAEVLPPEPVAEVLPEEETSEPEEEAPVAVEAVEPAEAEPEAEAVEITAEEPAEAEPEPAPAAALAAPKKPAAEIIADDAYPDAHRDEHKHKEHHLGALAEAERKQGEEEKRREAARRERPLPTPDPDVVAAVIRRAEEMQRRRENANREPRGTGGGAALRDAPGAGRLTQPREVVMSPEDIARAARGDRRPVAAGPAAGKAAAAKKKPKRAEKQRVLEEAMRRDAAAMVREFKSGTGLGVPKRRKKKRSMDDDMDGEMRGGTVEVEDTMTVEQLANAMEVPINELILALMDEEIMATKNDVLQLDVIRKLAARFNFDVKLEIPEEEDVMRDEPDDPEHLVLRAPVITVMGHVDHGKTSFLDVVREASVAAGEAGGITQHIAAYDVQIPTGRVVFLDTPGHAAFTEMRARGSQVTDVVVLMVAADDGVRPQTIEAIDHAKAAGVPIVVAINKCDKDGAQPDRVRQELTQFGLLTEEWGGNTQMQNISCVTREGIPELLELLGLESEMMELRANPKKSARGAVVESEITRGMGPTAWVLVQNGTLRIGDPFLCGQTYGRVRQMLNSAGKPIEEAGPSTPVLVTGLTEPASAGDVFVVVKEERVARAIAEKRSTIAKLKQGTGAKHMTLEDFHARMSGVEQKVLNVIVKADVQGSMDVLNQSLVKLGNEEVSVSVVHSGVGGVNESDVMLASASDAVVFGFHVAANAKAKKLAEQEGVEIRMYRVIYELMDDVRKALEGMLTPEKREIVTGHAEIRRVFRSSNYGNIAGSYQLDGETERGSLARLIRDDVVICETKIATVRREKDEVKSVATGFECGIKLDNYDDIQVGDIVECYKVESVAKTLA